MAESNDTAPGGVIGSYTPAPDVVEGWNTKVRGNNTLGIDGLVPFVQLIGIYSEDQIKRLTGEKTGGSGRTVGFINDPDNVDWTSLSNENSEEQTEYFESKIRNKYIGLNIKSYHQSSDDVYVPGIILATSTSQVGESYKSGGVDVYGHHSGGVGITELQIQSGTKEFTNRRYTLKLTVTDPQFLNDKPEYFKLSSLQSTFLIIHGWANPGDIPGWTGDPPPPIVNSSVWPEGTLSVDLKNPKSGGAWSAATVATTMFDFAFNEMGQLEASFTFMPREISFLNTYRVPVVSTIVRNFLGTGEMNQLASEETLDQPISRFAGLVAGFGAAAGEFGKNMADIIAEEQAAYFSGTNVESRYANISNTPNFSISDSLRNFSDRISEWSEDPNIQDDVYTIGAGEAEQVVGIQKSAESQNRFPYAGPGTRSYTKKTRSIMKRDGTSIDITEYETKIIYYSLGWVLEAIRLSMFDLNKNRILRGEKPFDVKFKYFPIPQNSFFNLAYQDEVKASVVPILDKFISEAISNFETKAFPKLRMWNPRYQELNTRNVNVPLDNEQVERAGAPGAPDEDHRTLWGNYTTEDGDTAPEDRYNIQPLKVEDVRGEPFTPHYQIMEPSTFGGKFDELQNLGDDKNLLTYEFRMLWEDLTENQKLSYIPNPNTLTMEQMSAMSDEELLNMSYSNSFGPGTTTADYRKSLVETGPDDPAGAGFVRIMHPEFEGQLLYSYSWAGAIQVQQTPHSDGMESVEITAAGRNSAGNCALRMLSEWNGYPTAATEDAYNDSNGGFLVSAVKNFFVGEIIAGVGAARTDPSGGRNVNLVQGVRYIDMDEYKPPPDYGSGFGIIMPAIAARYYHPHHYLWAQRTWYNKHTNFLRKHFSDVIINRMELALQSGLNAKSFGHEPVDLEWLTGRKYDLDTPIWPGAGSAATKADYSVYKSGNPLEYRQYSKMWLPPLIEDESEPYYQNHRNALLPLDAITEETEIEIAANVAEIESLESNRDVKINEKNDLETAVNGTGELGNFRGQEYYIADVAIQNLPPISEITYDSIVNIEDNYIELAAEGLGLAGQATWWRQRVGVLLVELYNLDLINLPVLANQSDGLTKGGRNRITAVTVDNTLYFQNLSESSAGYRGFYIATADHANLQPMVEIGQELSVSTYLAPNFPLEQVKMYSTPSLNSEGEDRFDYTITMEFSDQKYIWMVGSVNMNNISQIGNLNFSENGSGVNWLFENYIRKNSLQPLNISGNKFLDIYTGEQLAAEMSGRDIGLTTVVNEGGVEVARYYLDRYENQESANFEILYAAFQQYTDYIAKVHRLLERYFTKIGELDNLVKEKLADIATSKTEINEATELITTNQDILDILTGTTNEAFSPFLRENDFDTIKKKDLGGGRTMEIDGVAAQQWALRFANKVTFGSTDIAYYRIPRDGMEFIPDITGSYEWSNNMSWPAPEVTQALDDIRNDFYDGKIAKLDSWGEPKSILNMDRHYGGMVNYKWGPGVREAGYWIYGDIQPPEMWVHNQPSAIFSIPFEETGNNFDPRSHNRLYATNLDGDLMKTPKVRKGIWGWEFVQEGTSFPDNLDVIHLVRTGLVNEGLIKEQIKKNWAEKGRKVPQSIGFEDDRGVAVKIVGKWPLYIVPLWRGLRPGDFNPAAAEENPGVLTNYIGPAYLVDEDLSFVTQAKDVFHHSDFNADGTFNTDVPEQGKGAVSDQAILANAAGNITADTWLKMGMNFKPQNVEDSDLYAGVNSLPLYKGNHIPNVNIAMARKIVKTRFNYLMSNWGEVDMSARTNWRKHLISSGLHTLPAQDQQELVSEEFHRGQQYFFQGIGGWSGHLYGGRIPYNADYPLGIPIDAREYSNVVVGSEFGGAAAATRGNWKGGTGYPCFGSGVDDIGIQLVGQPQRLQKTVDGQKESFQKNWSYNFIDARASERYGGLVHEEINAKELSLSKAGSPGWFSSKLFPGATDFADYEGGGICVNDILNALPPEFERGFFSSVKYANAEFEEGTPIHPGVEKWISQNLINLFTNGRRVALRGGKPHLNNMREDVCYQDLFPDEEWWSEHGGNADTTFADFSNQSIQSVAEIPIKRKVVDNLLSQKNQNMSLMQLLQQLLAPSAIALAGNVQLGVRYNKGIIDIIPASIEYKGIVQDMFERAANNDAPSDQLLFDYKNRNSLIENIDMSSKMDPAAFLTYQNSSELLQGRDYNVLKLLSYEGVAEDFKEFLDNTDKPDNSGETYSGIISVNEANHVAVDKVRFEEIPSSIVDGFITQNPGRWATITAMMQSQNNFTTELLAFYMRGVTLTLHGTTNIIPFNLISVKGVLPDLEGIYIVTNVTEKIVPTGFQTILEGKLLKKKRDASLSFPTELTVTDQAGHTVEVSTIF